MQVRRIIINDSFESYPTSNWVAYFSSFRFRLLRDSQNMCRTCGHISVFPMKFGWSWYRIGVPQTKLAMAVIAPDVGISFRIQNGVEEITCTDFYHPSGDRQFGGFDGTECPLRNPTFNSAKSGCPRLI